MMALTMMMMMSIIIPPPLSQETGAQKDLVLMSSFCEASLVTRSGKAYANYFFEQVINTAHRNARELVKRYVAYLLASLEYHCVSHQTILL